MTTAEPKSQPSLQRRHQSLAIFILTSILVHGAGLLLLMFFERSPSAIKKEDKPTPIEFVVVPPETATEKPPKETKRQAPNNSVARGKVEPKKPTATSKPEPQPKTPPQVARPATPPQPQPKPTAASEPQKSSATPPPQTQPSPAAASKPTQAPATPPQVKEPVVTAKDSVPPKTPIPEQAQPEPVKPERVAKKSTPPLSQPEASATIVPSNPAPSSSASSGAASLLGGSYQRSLADDGGDSFFNQSAIASRAADSPEGLDARQNLDLGPYLEEIRRRVKRNWNPSGSVDERHTVLTFSIQKNGQITGLKIAQSSGSEIVDRESLRAVQQSAPFDALPPSYPSNALDIEFNFNIYIYR